MFNLSSLNNILNSYRLNDDSFNCLPFIIVKYSVHDSPHSSTNAAIRVMHHETDSQISTATACCRLFTTNRPRSAIALNVKATKKVANNLSAEKELHYFNIDTEYVHCDQTAHFSLACQSSLYSSH